MENYHIAVLDIGKTNKKILVYDSELNIVDERFTRIPENEADGILFDDVAALKAWILETLASLSKDYLIKVISTSAHGATYSMLDENLEIAVPQVAYNSDPGKDFHEKFYGICGDPLELQKNTATPNFNLLINPAKGILFTQQKFSEQYKKVRHIVLYPQYFSAWLTGTISADPTYVGNHSYLWNFEKRDWSDVTDKLGIRHLLPQTFKNPWDSAGLIKPEIAWQTGLSTDTIVTVGIHDSNASMLPYIISMHEPFLLNSTGTWCVIMNEKEVVKFESDELGKVVFYNISAFWKPIKTAIFLGGLEFEHYTGILQKIHGRRDFPKFDEAVYQKVILENDKFILPSVSRGIGQFPQSEPRVIENEYVTSLQDIDAGNSIPDFFRNYEVALAVLNLSLAIQTRVSFDRADIEPGMQVFTEGGFSKNGSYNTLLTSFYPDSKFYLTSLKEASAFGASLCGKAARENLDIKSLGSLINIDRIPVEGNNLKGLEAYFKKFVELI